MPINCRAEDDATLLEVAAHGGPVSVAYDKGYNDGLAIAAREVARLRAEIAAKAPPGRARRGRNSDDQALRSTATP